MESMHRMMLTAALGLGAHSAVGGWAVTTVENPPEVLEVGSTYRLEYSVRQHGVTLLDGLDGHVVLRPAGGGRELVNVAASAGSGSGRYLASFRVPDTDRVSLTVRSGFGPNELSLISIPVVRRGQPRPSQPLAERGRHLFVAKGCGTCHVNGDVPEFAQTNRVYGDVAPELTGRRLEASYIRQRLTNPSSLPKLGTTPVRMPDLGLAPPEVDALVALLSGTEVRAARN